SRHRFDPTGAPGALGVSAGGTVSTTVPLYTLPVLVKDTSSAPQSGAAVAAAETTGFAAPYTAVCTSGTGSGTVPTLGLVATDAAGNSVTAVPLGHWTITARKGTKAGSVNVWVKPDAVYAVNSSGASTTAYSAPITVV